MTLDAEVVIESLKSHQMEPVFNRLMDLLYNGQLDNDIYQNKNSEWVLIFTNTVDWFPYHPRYRVCVHLKRKVVEVDKLKVPRMENWPVLKEPIKVVKRSEPKPPNPYANP